MGLSMDSMSIFRKTEQRPRGLHKQLRRWGEKHREFLLPPPEKVHEREESFFDVKDADGKVRCRVLVAKSQEREILPWGDGIPGRSLLRCILVAKNGQEEVQIDVLKMIQERAPGIRVFLVYPFDEDLYIPSQNTILLHRMSNVFNIFILLHEFGHARQKTDERYKSIKGHYGTFNVMMRRIDRGLPVAKYAAEAFLEIGQIANAQEMRRQVHPKLRALSLIEKELEQWSLSAERRCSLQERQRELVMDMRDFLTIPKKILERDANVHMLQILREWRRVGIDLLVPLASADNERVRDLKAPGSCGSSTDIAIASALERMRLFLGTYKATTSQLRRTYGTIPRIKDKGVNGDG